MKKWYFVKVLAKGNKNQMVIESEPEWLLSNMFSNMIANGNITKYETHLVEVLDVVVL